MIKLNDKQKKIIDIIQWVCIVFLIIVCTGGLLFNKQNNFVKKADYQKEQTYVKIYESQNIESLKKENKELYDSIKNLQNVESAIQIKYIYRYKTDTIKVKEFVYNTTDSIYHYENDNDTISCQIDVKAQNLEWVQSQITVNDKFTIINREKDGQNQTFIDHGQNSEITHVDAWHRIEDKDKWYKRFHIGIQLGVGYGIIYKKPDVFVGFGINYNIK